MEMNPIGVFIPLNEVFPDTSNDFETFKLLLQQLSQTDTLFWCARLNLIVSNPTNINHKAKQEYGFHMIFTAEEIEKVNRFARDHGGASRASIFFRGQLLELIRWVCLFCRDHPDDGSTFDRPEVRHAFAQAVLMASDLWARRVYGDRFSLAGGRESTQQRALGAIREAIAETSSGMDPMMALGRGKALFSQYFPQFHPGFEEEFRLKTNLSLDEYYLCLCTLMTHFLNRTPEMAIQGTEYSGIFNND